MTKLVILAALALAASGCPRICQVPETRCNGKLVEMCGDDGDWHRALNCEQYGNWQCTDSDHGHTCRPEEE